MLKQTILTKMKTIKSFAFLLLGIIMVTACSSANKSSSSSGNPQSNLAKSKTGRDYASYTSLADILRQEPGVMIKGTGYTAEVSIRGINSIMLDTRPLYVYDGIELGRDYSRANNTIDRATIRSIRVISDLSQLSFYGERGRNGVIYIKSRK